MEVLPTNPSIITYEVTILEHVLHDIKENYGSSVYTCYKCFARFNQGSRHSIFFLVVKKINYHQYISVHSRCLLKPLVTFFSFSYMTELIGCRVAQERIYVHNKALQHFHFPESFRKA